MVSVGTIIWLSSELMFFAALFASYFTIRAVSQELWAQNTQLLDVPFAAVNTTVLVPVESGGRDRRCCSRHGRHYGRTKRFEAPRPPASRRPTL